MPFELPLGIAAERSLVVAEEHTAERWGSGLLRVFSTPYMIALMEGAAVDAVDHLLPAGFQTVGIELHVRHLAATPIGRPVRARAALVATDGRKLTFRVEAYDDAGQIGTGEHQRFVIELERFMQKAQARGR